MGALRPSQCILLACILALLPAIFMIPYHYPNASSPFTSSSLSALTSLPLTFTGHYNGTTESTPKTWLLATMGPVRGLQRRALIRSTWQKWYPHPAFTKRFVVSQPTDLWLPIIQQENDTYGDMIIMPGLKDDAKTANTIKTIEFIRMLVTTNQKYKFISKIDDDSFLDAVAFYEMFLEPRLTDTNATLIGKQVRGHREDKGYQERLPWSYPQGGFYTINWEMALALTHAWETNPIPGYHEDMLVGRLLYENKIEHQEVWVPKPNGFDYDKKSKWVWAHSHDVSNTSVHVHQLKNDDMYLEVAKQIWGMRNGEVIDNGTVE